MTSGAAVILTFLGPQGGAKVGHPSRDSTLATAPVPAP
jgi:hypothetical protein